METASSISRRRPQTEVTPYLGNRSGGSCLSKSETTSGHEPDAVRANLCLLPARTSSATGAWNRLISNLRRLLSNAEEATATAAAAAATAATAVAGVDLASSQQISAIIGERKEQLSPTKARTTRTGASRWPKPP